MQRITHTIESKTTGRKTSTTSDNGIVLSYFVLSLSGTDHKTTDNGRRCTVRWNGEDWYCYYNESESTEAEANAERIHALFSAYTSTIPTDIWQQMCNSKPQTKSRSHQLRAESHEIRYDVDDGVYR